MQALQALQALDIQAGMCSRRGRVRDWNSGTRATQRASAMRADVRMYLWLPTWDLGLLEGLLLNESSYLLSLTAARLRPL